MHKCCSLLSYLPATTSLIKETDQLETVYGLLSRKIRKIVSRDSVQTFNELITASRKIEVDIMNSSVKLTPPSISTLPMSSAGTFVQLSSAPNKKSRAHCRYCKNYDNTKEECKQLISKNCDINLYQTCTDHHTFL